MAVYTFNLLFQKCTGYKLRALDQVVFDENKSKMCGFYSA